MEDDLEELLIGRRVAQDKINLMKRDKIDKAVLMLITDQQLAHYIPTYGDRLAVISFCQQQLRTPDRETLLDRIREKIGDRKKKRRPMPSESSRMARKQNTSGEKEERKIEIGWLHYSHPHFTQVRTRHGGGTRHITVHKTTTVQQVLETGNRLFFPNGFSTKGSQENFHFEVCDFKRNVIPFEETVGNLYETTKLKLLRFYICTKHKLSDQSSEEEESDSSIEDGEDLHTKNLQAVTSDPRASDSFTTVISDGNEETDSIMDVDTASEQSSDLDIEVTSPSRVKDSNASSDSDTLEWHSDDDEVTVQMRPLGVIKSTPAASSGATDASRPASVQLRERRSIAQESPETSQSTPAASSGPTDASRPASVQLRERRSIAQESPETSQSTPAASSGPTDASRPAFSTRFHRASIRRIKVVDDVLSVFKDSNIIDVCLKMDLVSENAVDDSGVSREVYTAFWEMFLQQCDGDIERVPRLRPDYCQAVGRVWVKGLLDLGVMPVMLSKGFIVACLHGMDAVDADLLIMSFLNYLPPVERAAVERALEGKMEEDDEDDLLDLFSQMGSHSLPPKDNMRAAIETMAHKAILQEAKFVRDCFSTVMMAIKKVSALYESKKPTGKRVVQLLETTKAVLSQREQTVLSYLQRYVKNSDQTKVEKLLRFCTGSSVICVDKVMVSFNVETGLNRRPIGHTCGATLEVPCTYSSFPDFRTEFDNVLLSNNFEMDIV
ncbi:hypothetical protein N1851_028966 [Merluccius polli]|uniref:HECT domain-containing protein n=1 Tax=Merluccius polli TaxID=89951 RepID=A0AA47NR38_MERPO|nr:hypothetical protein N1851_028966 [Merluccius polli]